MVISVGEGSNFRGLAAARLRQPRVQEQAPDIEPTFVPSKRTPGSTSRLAPRTGLARICLRGPAMRDLTLPHPSLLGMYTREEVRGYEFEKPWLVKANDDPLNAAVVW